MSRTTRNQQRTYKQDKNRYSISQKKKDYATCEEMLEEGVHTGNRSKTKLKGLAVDKACLQSPNLYDNCRSRTRQRNAKAKKMLISQGKELT